MRDVRVSTVAVARQLDGHRRRNAAGQPAAAVLARPHRGAAHAHRRAGGRQEARGRQRGRVAAAAGRRLNALASPLDMIAIPPSDQGRRCDPADIEDVMAIKARRANRPGRADAPRGQEAGARRRGRAPALDFKAARATATDFSRVLNSMFNQMFTGIDGDGVRRRRRRHLARPSEVLKCSSRRHRDRRSRLRRLAPQRRRAPADRAHMPDQDCTGSTRKT